MRRYKILTYFYTTLAVYAFMDLLFRNIFYLVTKVETVAQFYGVSIQTVVNALIIVAIIEVIAAISALFTAKYLQDRVSVNALLRAATVCSVAYITYGIYNIYSAYGDFAKYASPLILMGSIDLIIGLIAFYGGYQVYRDRLRAYAAIAKAAPPLASTPKYDSKTPDEVLPLTKNEIRHYSQALSHPWKVLDDKKMVKEYKFKNFHTLMEFVEQTLALAETEHHHPVMTINHYTVRIELTTNAIDGLSETDFLLAQQIESIHS